MGELTGKRIVLGVTGGVAAYKAAELVRALVREQAAVEVVLTATGARFVSAATFQALSGNPVWLDLWDDRASGGMAHIELGRRADAIVVAPASADFLAKLACGLADDLLSTLCLARPAGRVLMVAPAMNREMWDNPATRRNAARLREDGVALLGPADGEQACGETGPGRMAEPCELIEALIATFQPRRLAGRRLLITAGPTFEPIDPVRGLTNLSSGRMGYALARAAAEAGAAVTLVSGPVSLATPGGVERVDVLTALQMREAVLSRLADIDLFIAVAAVCDFRAAEPSVAKVKKEGASLSLPLARNPDILAEVAARPDAPFCVGFAAETERLEEQAEAKRRAKGLPLLVGNLVQEGMGGENSRLVLFDDGGMHPIAPGSKREIARRLIGEIAARLPGGAHG